MTQATQRPRLLSLDAFRGLTIAGMILVNNPGDWRYVYAPLHHAEWHGWTPTDWIFPFFLFIMGVAMALSLRMRIDQVAGRGAVRGKIIRRTLILFGLGLVLSGYPRFDLSTIRIMGVLQRIALCYLAVAATMMMLPRPRSQWLVMGGLLAVYLSVMYGLDVPGHGRGVLTPEGHASGYIDRLVLGGGHLSTHGLYDAEGLVSTLTASLSVLLGLQFGLVLVRYKEHADRLRQWLTWGMILTGAGLLLDLAIPINKVLWTPSYVLFTAGLAGLFLAACYWLIEVRGWTRWSMPFVMLGMNPLIIFFLSGFLVRNLILIKVGDTSLWRWLYVTGFEPYLSAYNASLAFALANLVFWLLVAWVMYHKGWFVKI
ncbi:hypothetical protein ES708_14486 [subsurface metagenome]